MIVLLAPAAAAVGGSQTAEVLQYTEFSQTSGAYTIAVTDDAIQAGREYALILAAWDVPETPPTAVTLPGLDALKIRYLDQRAAESTTLTFPNVGLMTEGKSIVLLGGVFNEDGTDTTPRVIGFLAPDGVSVKGRIRSYNPGNVTTICFLQDGVERYRTNLAAEAAQTDVGPVTQAFELTAVQDGVYDLVVSKPGHLTYTLKSVVVAGETVNLSEDTDRQYSTLTLLAGDLNNDGHINLSDVNIVRRHANYQQRAEAAENGLADLNGDHLVDLADIDIIRQVFHYYKNAADSIFVYGES